MAGSYNHATDNKGRLRNESTMTIATETQGDAYETIQEMYGMIWFLARGENDRVRTAIANWRTGIALSPGVEPE